ncbi:MAG: transcriptional regulator [Pseudomonadota bacterium]
MKTSSLAQRRSAIENLRARFDGRSVSDRNRVVSADILNSWRRSAAAVNPQFQCAPRDEEYEVRSIWQQSPLSLASRGELDNLTQLVNEGHYVAAISDCSGRLLWTRSSTYMRSRAENLNFIQGGHWDERSVGTNAVGLSVKLRRPVTVFSSEHYSPFVQDWVCYAAPIMQSQTGECVGVLDISTTWEKHTPLGESATTQIANSIAEGLPVFGPRAELEVYALGQPRIVFRGNDIRLPLRQLEILCLLALNPDGIDLENLYLQLYSDSRHSMSTLKSDVSNLRRRLGGEIGSRPYRLTVGVWADFVDIWKQLTARRWTDAQSIYRGSLLPKSDAPGLREWRNCVDAHMDACLHRAESYSTGAQTNAGAIYPEIESSFDYSSRIIHRMRS